METAPPNVPEFKPDFVQQTRAPAVHTQTPFKVTELAAGFANPWGIAFLPDGRVFVTEKTDGRLLLVSLDSKQPLGVDGVPRVAGADQGGMLDVALGPGYTAGTQHRDPVAAFARLVVAQVHELLRASNP